MSRILAGKSSKQNLVGVPCNGLGIEQYLVVAKHQATNVF